MLSANDNFGGISGTIQKHYAVHYGNTGCLVFKFERFLPKNQHNQRKLLNFKNWCNGEVSKIKIGHHIRKQIN